MNITATLWCGGERVLCASVVSPPSSGLPMFRAKRWASGLTCDACMPHTWEAHTLNPLSPVWAKVSISHSHSVCVYVVWISMCWCGAVTYTHSLRHTYCHTLPSVGTGYSGQIWLFFKPRTTVVSKIGLNTTVSSLCNVMLRRESLCCGTDCCVEEVVFKSLFWGIVVINILILNCMANSWQF